MKSVACPFVLAVLIISNRGIQGQGTLNTVFIVGIPVTVHVYILKAIIYEIATTRATTIKSACLYSG